MAPPHCGDSDAALSQNSKETLMADPAASGRGCKHWLWLLLLPFVATLWVPFYNRIDPQLAGFPFFYWYQLLVVIGSAAITALVYIKTKHLYRPESREET
jgi:hypothetical protein